MINETTNVIISETTIETPIIIINDITDKTPISNKSYLKII
jgi:hypothetical protein